MRSTILLFLALAVSAFGQAFPGTSAYQAAFLKPAAGGGGCTTLAGDFSGSYIADNPLGNAAQSKYFAVWFNASATETWCRVDVNLKTTGSPTFTITASIYTYSGGTPGALVGSASTPVNASSIGSSYGYITFSGLSASLTSGNDYCLVLTSSATDGSNYVQWRAGQISDPGHDTEWRSSNGSAWTAIDIANISRGEFKAYK
jgi:hypothetical protein